MRSTLTPAQAYWNQRHIIHQCQSRWKKLAEAVGSLSDLSLYQWAQMGAFALEFKPELILELGRLYGNSTCVFLEVVNSRVHRCHLETHSEHPDYLMRHKPLQA